MGKNHAEERIFEVIVQRHSKLVSNITGLTVLDVAVIWICELEEALKKLQHGTEDLDNTLCRELDRFHG